MFSCQKTSFPAILYLTCEKIKRELRSVQKKQGGSTGRGG